MADHRNPLDSARRSLLSVFTKQCEARKAIGYGTIDSSAYLSRIDRETESRAAPAIASSPTTDDTTQGHTTMAFNTDMTNSHIANFQSFVVEYCSRLQAIANNLSPSLLARRITEEERKTLLPVVIDLVKDITSDMVSSLAADEYSRIASRQDTEYLSFLTYMVTPPEDKTEKIVPQYARD